MTKFNQGFLTKLEKLIQEGGYIIRYERGSFQSGYCILEHKKVVVLNKFLDIEGRINTVIDLLPVLDINFDSLTYDQQKLLETILPVENSDRRQNQ